MTSDMVFMDTETLGLDPNAPIWEFAAIRRFSDGNPDQRHHFFINHTPASWVAGMPKEFRDDYEMRYDKMQALSEQEAASAIRDATSGAHIVGAVPNFDTERLEKLLRRNGRPPKWHYHLIDVENLVVGYLAAKGQLMPAPWDSEELSKAVGVDPAAFKRHTAMGDVQWVQAQYDAVMAAE